MILESASHRLSLIFYTLVDTFPSSTSEPNEITGCSIAFCKTVSRSEVASFRNTWTSQPSFSTLRYLAIRFDDRPMAAAYAEVHVGLLRLLRSQLQYCRIIYREGSSLNHDEHEPVRWIAVDPTSLEKTGEF